MNKRPSDTASKQDVSPLTLLRELWLGSCARYTVLCLLMMAVSAILSDSLTVTYIEPVRFFLLLPFAVFLTLATRTRLAKKMSKGVKCLLHPVLVLGGFYLCCYLPFQVSSKPSGQQVLILVILALVVYGVCMGAFLAISHALGRKKTDDAPYVSQYNRPGSSK